ncbi:Dibenzothiophene desulfurization enzyme C [Mycolicibacterium conceptionense]|uniref:Dibenzothiophene desulfurization enzyme C n=1 Tax=Mycolicibacterium conceptionense TaxID=451644 RepID=A0A0U1DEZ6_9MYCO|nr:Dibenzothiophene desulfurization enzyme C [Mycolicibacterium conceptionense]CQD12802.1 Dibenzothiophene desulfurization enzyme C [Mycolicibacterium conceptionense]
MTLTDDTTTAQNSRHGDPIEVARELTRKWQTTVVERDKAGGSATEEREDLRASGCSR